MKLGMILVLFILLVVVTSIFSGSWYERNPQDGNLSAQGSVGFNIYNQMRAPFAYTLVATELDGDFESPTPTLHEIPPGGGHKNFQVNSDFFKLNEAYVTYQIVSVFREVLGEIEIKMQTKFSSPSTEILEFEIYSPITPVRYNKGNTYVTITN
ncbi:hypothetical protein SAMN05444162_1867 [Paenibacillaceae bacterium GAS479]|nr:hypothetical protein SAMN05444162_1867 [Paenibacillaceae bacterium GAS479]